MQTALGMQMRKLAESGHPRASELIEAADKFDLRASQIRAEVYDVEDHKLASKRFLGAWARARRIYCECTGESLI